jgi:magnesium transporter
MRSEELLVTSFFQEHPDDAAKALEASPAQEAAALLESVEPEAAAAVVGRMASIASAACLVSMNPEPAAAIMAELPVDVAIRLLRKMSPRIQEAMLELLPEKIARPARLLLQYPENTAGALMDPLAAAVPDDIVVDQVHRLIRNDPDGVFYYLYVVDREHRLTGVLDLRELMRADPSVPVGSIMHTDLVTLPAGMDLVALLRHPGWRDLDALPVIDEKGVFLGMIRQRLIRQLSQAAEQEGQMVDSWKMALALGELYWIGVGKFFELLTDSSQPQADSALTSAEGETK